MTRAPRSQDPALQPSEAQRSTPRIKGPVQPRLGGPMTIETSAGELTAEELAAAAALLAREQERTRHAARMS